MNAIARELDAKLAMLNSAQAAALGRAVREAIALANSDEPSETALPVGFFDRIRQQWGDEPFERPAQGEFEGREDW
jgi:hypothetical protein